MTPSEAADSSLSQKRFLHYISSAVEPRRRRTDGRTDDRHAILKFLRLVQGSTSTYTHSKVEVGRYVDTYLGRTRGWSIGP